MSPETDAQREARWAAERARQAAWREANKVMLAERRASRLAAGLCVLEAGQCITHDEPDDLAHYFNHHPGAFND